MRRTRRAGRKHQLAKLAWAARRTVATRQSLLGTFECTCGTVNTTPRIDPRTEEITDHAGDLRVLNPADREEVNAHLERVFETASRSFQFGVIPQRPVEPRCRIIQDQSLTAADRLLYRIERPGDIQWRLDPVSFVPSLPNVDDICIDDPRYFRYCQLRRLLLNFFY